MILQFNHEGYEVITSSWTASFSNGKMDVAYLWGADGLSWFDSATSVRRIKFRMANSTHFLNMGRSGLIDLRGREV